MAGFHHVGLVEIDRAACETLRYNRPEWNIIEGDLRAFDGRRFRGIDLLSGGVPCPPFSTAGNRLGPGDERDLFPEIVRLTSECSPKAVMIENVPGIMTERFDEYREHLDAQFRTLGYEPSWRKLKASDFGVSQLRPRVVMVALPEETAARFHWPEPLSEPPRSMGQLLSEEMASLGWRGAKEWAKEADRIAPTLVGGSKKHGGPDLGPTRAKKAWAEIGVNGHTIAETPPGPDFTGMPRLTVQMAARIQGFPPSWHITGRKTSAYGQVANAFPPPVAQAVAIEVCRALLGSAEIEIDLRSEASSLGLADTS